MSMAKSEDFNEFRASWRRWPIIILFFIFCTNTAFQFTQMLSVSDVVARFYRVDENVIVWMTTLTHVTQAVFELPAAFLSGLTSLRARFI